VRLAEKVSLEGTMLLFLLVDMNLVVLSDLETGAVVRAMLPGMFGCKRRSGEQREKQNRRKNSLHGVDGSTHAFGAGRKSSARHQ